MKYHTDKNGNQIPIKDLGLRHLENIIKYIERKSVIGVKVRNGGGTTADDMWYDEYTCYGEEAKERLNYQDYVDELNLRRSKQ